jgi:perosamine synthetase
MSELEALAAEHGLGLLEDACEALGAVDSEGRVGARGNLATFAFYANKQMTTGEGGMVVPSDPDVAAALGVAQMEKLDAMLAGRARVATLYREGLEGLDGLSTPIAARGQELRSWFVYAVQLPEGTDRDATVTCLAELGVASKAYLPCIHLFPHLRELGYREGQFPVAEAASARSLALPFFPSMTESQVARVCEALAQSLR